MATGYDRDKYVYHSKQQLPDASAKNASSDGKHGVWKRKPRTAPSIKFPEDDDVFDNSDTDEDANFPHSRSTKPRGAGNARGDRHRGHSFRNAEDSSLWRQRSPGQGFDSSNWRIQGERQEESRKFRSSSYSKSVSSYRGSTSFAPRVSDGEELNAGSWRNTKSLQEKGNRADALESGGISRDFFRRPGRGVVKANLEEDFDIPRSEETSSVSPDGPHAASWRKTRRHSQQRQADNLDEGEVCESRTNITREFFRRPAKSVARTGRKDTKDMKTEDEDLIDSDSNSAYYSDDGLTSQQRQTFAPYLRKTEMKHEVRASSFSNYELESFLDEKSQDALLKLVSQRERCQALFSADELDENTLLLTVRVLSCMSHLDQVSDTLYTREVNVILSMLELSSFFSKHLTRYLVGLSSRQADDCDDADTDGVRSLAADIDLILDILQLFLQRKPLACSEVSVVLVLLQKVVTTAAVNNVDFDPQGYRMAKVEEVKECCSSLEGSLKTTRERMAEKPPPDNFRTIPIFPKSAELRQTGKPFLRKNIVRGRYDSVEHYLDVQFRLLREDFVAPMREGVTEFISTPNGRLQDIRVYYEVSIEAATMGANGIVHTLKFQLRRRRPERWETSKRLLYGSFVCLSRDSFKHILCATVENRNVTDLQNGQVQVRFLTEPPRHYKGPFIMAESAAYFEAYRHVLLGLQQMNEENFPFRKYIVDVAKQVQPPQYLKVDEEVTYDLRPLLTCSDEKSNSNNLEAKQIVAAAYVPILDSESWPNAEVLHLDDSQKDALQTALTREFAIIQGPPGTGKTYIGLKIVELLLYNTPWSNNQTEEVKTSPILVVCYTNHALDQFLEGIMDFGEQKVVRVGNRSSSEKLENKSLSRLRKQRPSKEYREEKSRLQQMSKELAQLDEAIQRTLLKLDLPNKAIIDVMALRDLMSPGNFRDLSSKVPQMKEKSIEKSSNLMLWLEVGDGSTEQSQGEVADPEQNPSGTTDDTKEFMEVDDEGAEIQRERQFDDSEDFVEDRDQRRKTLESKIFYEDAAHSSEHTLDSKSVAEMEKSDTMTGHEAAKTRRIWKLKLHDRWRLYRLWIKLYKEKHGAELSGLRQRYMALSEAIETLKAQEDLEILRKANVIGMTTTGAARCRNVLQLLGPLVVVIEEAAEVLEAHIITTLTAKCQHLILIGDHQQLKPNPTVYRLAKLFNLDTSLFERMINNGMPCNSLSLQHRMRPEISELMKKHFYKRLQDDESVLNMGNIPGVQNNMFFLNHRRLEDGLDDNRTRSNQHEAEVLVGLCKYLLDQGYQRSQVTILTTYKGQMFCIKRLMDRATFDGVRVTVVDNFQGEENDIILLSLVRSNEEGSIGFLRTSNRVCVALSRARMGFYCIGNFTILKKAPVWHDIISTMEAQNKIDWSLPLVCQNHPNKISQVTTAKDFKEKVPCGGCDKSCDYSLLCGHVCHLSCHPYDPNHLDYKCHRPCNRYCERGEHKCLLECYQKCNPCQEKVQKLMPGCGHGIQVSCCQFDTVSCPEPCPKLFANCGHPCRKKCGELCSMTCPEKCEKSLGCGHPCLGLCGLPCDRYCKVQVERTLEKCGHKVFMDCSQIEISCPKPCLRRFEGCKHLCRKKCGDRCPEVCPEKCERKLACGHPCKELCSEICTQYCLVKVKRILPTCGHEVVMDCDKDLDDIECNARVKKAHPVCGHYVVVACCEDPEQVQCKMSVIKRRKCGHLKAMSCFIDPDSKECTERCDKILCCGHQCPNKCGKPCTVSGDTNSKITFNLEMFGIKLCEVDVEKTYPSCSHVVKLPCHKDVSQVPCTSTCGKLLVCGHRCPKKCSQPCPRDNLSSTFMTLYVEHGMGFSSFCREKCGKFLLCGHACPNRCGEPCPSVALANISSVKFSTKCKQLVEKTLPGCGHTAKVECFKDVSLLSCSEICGKKLSCGHVCQNKCGMPCKCFRSVLKKLPNCRHFTQLPCHQDPSSYECKEHCQRKLICGHQCPNKCSEPCPGEEDSSTDEDEPGSSLGLSGTRIPARRCTEIVRKEFIECYHSVDLPCYKDISTVRCKERCEEILPCGHQCPNTCSNCVEEDAFSSEDEEAKHRPLYTKCKVNVQKILPCGHSQEVACWLQNSTKPCLVSCTAILSCGHTCSGNCDDCHEGRQHVTCTGKCKRQLLCGHSCRDICGRDCPSDCKSCTDEYKVRPSLLCRRELRGRDLKTFPCPHGITNRQLKSKACILRCAHKRSCRHECVGVCGEPCPPYCSVCDKYWYKDNLPNKHIRQKETFIYLPDCGHLCETRLLDKIAACFLKPVKNGCYEIRSLVCPKCKEPVLNCPRYDDILHIIKKSVEAAKLKCDQARKDSPTGRLSRVYRSLGNKSATPTWSFAVGRWLRCPRGHVFYLENGQQEGSNGPVCPECSKE